MAVLITTTALGLKCVANTNVVIVASANPVLLTRTAVAVFTVVITNVTKAVLDTLAWLIQTAVVITSSAAIIRVRKGTVVWQFGLSS